MRVDDNGKGIICEGQCVTWYHPSCMGMSDEHYNDLTKDTKNKWKCPPCQLYSIEFESAPPRNIESDVISILKARQNDLDKNEEANTENDLALAAEIGSSLLKENIELKRENGILQQKIMSLLALTEENDQEIKTLHSHEEALAETCDSLSKQLIKERQQHVELQNRFEEHDTEQERLIARLKAQIEQLKGSRPCKPNKMINEDSPNDKLPDESLISKSKVGKHQTKTNFDTNTDTTSLLSKIKALECRVSNLEDSYSPSRLANSSSKLTKESSKENIMPIAITTREEHITVPRIEPRLANPPMFAVIRDKDESLEDFFHRFLKLTGTLKTTNLNEVDSLSQVNSIDPIDTKADSSCLAEQNVEHFLGYAPSSKDRWKTSQKERLIINSSLKK